MHLLPLNTPLSSSRRFELLSELGQGGMGVVYEAVDRERGMRVALKTLRQLDSEALVRLKQEFRSLQDLHHPNLVSLGELVEEAGTWLFTMELVRGSNFLQHVRPSYLRLEEQDTSPRSTEEPTEQQLPPWEQQAGAVHGQARDKALPARALVESTGVDEGRLRAALGQLSLGLHALHRAGKVHRDVKPSNILVTEQGRVVLLDFGILADTSTAEPQEVGRPGLAVGTASYMAPEQGRGAPPAPAADWYSVGVLLYQALCGYLPFSGSPREVMAAKQHLQPVPPQERVAGLPQELCALCMDLLYIDPARRPSGEQVLQQLGLQQAASRDEALFTGTLPFVGRQSELQALHRALEDSRQGCSVVVLVQGESGVGKSRLVRHFLSQVSDRQPQAVVLTGRCYERESMPYKGVEGLIDSLARHLRTPGAPPLARLLPPEAPLLAWLFPVLQSVHGFPQAQAPDTGEPLHQRLAAFAALRELFCRLARSHPVVLWLDDLQWAERDGLALLDELLQAPGLLLVATMRLSTETQPETDREGSFQREARVVELEGLPGMAALELVGRLTREGCPPEEARRIALESGGHPLFIDALVRFRTTEGGQGSVRLEEALRSRARVLEPAAYQLLELLVVAGGPLPNAVAASAASLDYGDYVRLAASLRAAHLALTSGPAGTDMIELFHSQVRRALEPQLATPQRLSWHMRLAVALESLPQRPAEALAHHWLEAGHVDRAITYYLQAAREAAATLAFSREAQLYRTVLGLRAWEPPEQHRWHLALALALSKAGRGGEAAKSFLAAAAVAPGDEALSMRLRAVEQLLLSGHVDEGLAIAQQALASVGLPYPRTPAATLGSLLWLQLRSRLLPSGPPHRQPQEVSPLLWRQLQASFAVSLVGSIAPLLGSIYAIRYGLLAEKAGSPMHLCRALSIQVVNVAMMGVSQRPRVQRMLQRTEAVLLQGEVDLFTRGYAMLARAWSEYFFGEFLPAREHFQRGLQLCLQCPEATLMLNRGWFLGSSVLGNLGELTELSRFLVLPVAEARERNDLHGLLSLRLGNTSYTWLARGDTAGARQEVHELLGLWMREGYSIQHYMGLLSELSIDLYEGAGQVALERLAAAQPKLERYMLLRAQTVRCRVVEARARAALQVAARGGPKAESLLRRAEADARRLEHEGMAYTMAQAELVRAGVAAARKRPEQAAQHYRRALGTLELKGLGLYAAAARLRLGALVGGEEGQSLTEQARSWLRGQGVLDPEAMAALFAPVGDA